MAAILDKDVSNQTYRGCARTSMLYVCQADGALYLEVLTVFHCKNCSARASWEPRGGQGYSLIAES